MVPARMSYLWERRLGAPRVSADRGITVPGYRFEPVSASGGASRRSRRGPAQEGLLGDSHLALGRPTPHGHLGSQAQQQLQGDLDERCWNSDLRGAAAHRTADGPVVPDPLHAFGRERSSPGYLLRDDGSQPESRLPFPQFRIHRLPRTGRPQQSTALRGHTAPFL